MKRKLSAQRLPWTAADAPEFCGPEHLARAVQMCRSWDASPESEGRLSRDSVARLIELCYRVSLTTEEGRHPSFVAFAPAPAAAGHLLLLTEFAPAIPLHPQSLRRLVPSIHSGGHAFCIEEREEGALFARGVMALRDAADVPQLGRPAISFGLGLPGLTVRVDGPGHVRVTEKGLTWELHTGHVRPVSHYAVLRIVQDWFGSLALSLVRRFRDEAGDDALREREGLGDPVLVFDSVWSYILASAVATGHGGAFAVLPDAEETWLEIKHRTTSLDLFGAVMAYWSACFDSSRITDSSVLERRTSRWEAARRAMYASARAMANLANVDGCVVLDSRLRVVGFGAEIRVPEAVVSGTRCVEPDHEMKEVHLTTDLQQFGTRHRSAFRLCAARPGTLVFVVSQDRDMRVFYGRRDKPGEVCLWQSLGAWMAGDVM